MGRINDDELTQSAVVDNTQVIMEDVVMIEAQQNVISSRGPLQPIPIKADRAVVAVQKVLKRLHENSDLLVRPEKVASLNNSTTRY